MEDNQVINISSFPLFHLYRKVVWSFWQMGFVRKFLVPIKLFLKKKIQAEENYFKKKEERISLEQLPYCFLGYPWNDADLKVSSKIIFIMFLKEKIF